MKPMEEKWGGTVEAPIWQFEADATEDGKKKITGTKRTAALHNPQIALHSKILSLDLAMLAEVPPDATIEQLIAARDQLVDRIMRDIEVHLEALVPNKHHRAAIEDHYYTEIAWRWPIEPVNYSLQWKRPPAAVNLMAQMGAPLPAPYDAQQRQQATLGQWITWPPEAAPLAVAEWMKARFTEVDKAKRIRSPNPTQGEINSMAEWADGVITLLKEQKFFPDVRTIGGIMSVGLFDRGLDRESQIKELQATQNALDQKLGVSKDPNGKMVPIFPSLPDNRPVFFTLATCARIFLAEQLVEDNKYKQRFAVDAGRPHHKTLAIMASSGTEESGKRELVELSNTRYQIVRAGNPVQLTLNLDGTPHEIAIHELKKLLGPEGLKNWAGLQRQFSVDGGRSGRITWRLDQHMKALGYGDRVRHNPKRRKEIAKIVELFTQLELLVYNPRKPQEDWIRRRMIIPLEHRGKGNPFIKSDARLEGMVLQINPLLYEGVRNQDTGEIGSNWYPAPVALPEVNHTRHPYAHALGLILSIRFRLIWAERNQHYLHLAGHSILEMAGIKIKRNKPTEAWESLERDLDELKRIELLSSWAWISHPRTSAGIIELHPARWIIEQVKHGVQPHEKPPAIIPQTGTELLKWRKARGISQAELASQLKITERTIRNAEKKTDAALPKPLRDKLTAAQII